MVVKKIKLTVAQFEIIQEIMDNKTSLKNAPGEKVSFDWRNDLGEVFKRIEVTIIEND